MSRQLRLNLLLLFSAILIACLVAECLLRLSGLGTTNGIIMIHDSVLVQKPFHEYYNRVETTNWVHLNNLGFHDRDRAVKNTTYRILVIGDSFVEGVQVPTNDLFTRVLEGRFAQSSLAPIEIVNCGLSGTQTAFQYKLWHEYLEGTLSLGYDHVLLVMFLGNDLTDNLAPRVETDAPNGVWFLNEQGTLVTNKREDGPLKSAVKVGRNYSALVNTVYSSLYRLRRMQVNERIQRRDDATKGREVGLERLAISGKVTLKLIEAWARELRRSGKSFDVALIPGFQENEKDPPYAAFVDLLRQSGKRTGFGVVYLEIDHNRPEYCFLEGHGHLNVRGHSFVADALYEWLGSRYARGWSSSPEG